MQRYERLLGWALQISDQDRARAEDLVHDTFIQFTLSQPALDNLYNVDGYLYTMLRNMNLSQIRRTVRLRDAAPSLADFDSAELGIRTIDPRNQIQVREELRLICQYACARKNSSKAGSVLMLRFFHGYYPSEIARILRTTPAAVDQWLRIARREVRLYLSDRESLNFIGATEDIAISYPGTSSQTDDALAQLLAAIFSTPRTACLSKDDLRENFSLRVSAALDNKILSHITTCAHCLDEVNRILHLPPLSERHPAERLGPDRDSNGGDGPKGPGSGSAAAFTKRSRRQLKEVIEHRPAELRIAVNGFVLGAQKVSSEVSELSLSISQTEKIGFVEVFSEQELRLMFLSIEPPPDGQAEYSRRVDLSDGRTLELALRFSDTWPNLYVIYRDPALGNGSIPDSALDTATAPIPAQPMAEHNVPSVKSFQNRLIAFVAWVRAFDPRCFLRPAPVTVLIALLMLAAVAVRHWRAPAPPLTAAGLLQSASVAEDTAAARSDQVLHRTISLEERSSTGSLIARHRIDVWQSGERGITARRLYDERGTLIAGDWRRSDGVQTLYHHGQRPQIKPVPQGGAGAQAINFDNVWQFLPSAKEFSSLIGETATAHVDEQQNIFVISFSAKSADDSAPSASTSTPSAVKSVIRLVKATLTLSKTDLHPTEETLLIQAGDEAREYRFVETSFERRPPNSVAPAVFEPDVELLGSDTGSRRRVDTETVTASPSLPVPASPVLATPALEVEVLRLLNQAGADLGEQINVTRTPAGQLSVQGVIDTPQRRDEILRALRPVVGNPAVHIEINTVAEAVRRQPQTSPRSTAVTVEGVQPAANSIPVDADVRRYLSARGISDGQMDQEVQRFANRAISKSRQAMYHAAAMKRLAERFSPDELRTLDADARAKWLALIRQHARAFQGQSAAVRQELAPVFNVAASGGEASSDLRNTDALIRAVTHLFELSAANYNAIQSAFTISNAGSTSTRLKSAQFWRAMRDAESLAEKIANSP